MLRLKLSSYFLKKKYCVPVYFVIFILLDSYNIDWSKVQEHTDHKWEEFY